MRVSDWMTRNVVTVAPTTSIRNARRLMDAYGIRHLPVVSGEVLVGIVSDHDVRLNDAQLVAAAQGSGSELAADRTRPVSAVMSSPVNVAFPEDDLTWAARFMASRRISAMPVVEGDALVGIISVVDCLDALVAGHRRPARGGTGEAPPAPGGRPRQIGLRTRPADAWASVR